MHLVNHFDLILSEKQQEEQDLIGWDKLDIEIHESLEEYISKYGLNNIAYLGQQL